MATDFPDDTSLRIRRTLQASPARVWEAFTTPEQMARWMWASYKGNTTANADLRIGGRYDCYTDAQDMESGWDGDRWGFAGLYVEIIPHERLVYTDSPADENGNVISPAAMGMPDGYPETTEVTVLLEEVDGRTKMVMTHAGIPADSGGAGGWAQAFDKLGDHIETVLGNK